MILLYLLLFILSAGAIGGLAWLIWDYLTNVRSVLRQMERESWH